MFGMMMDRPLLISSLITHAARYNGDTEIISRQVDRSLFRYTWADCEQRSKKLANLLSRMKINQGDRIATLAWNNHRHLELYYGISGFGAVLHTINPRLFHDQITYIANHAEDRILCFDPSFLPLVEQLAPNFTTIRHYILMGSQAEMPARTSLDGLLCYETLLEAETADFDWPLLDEKTASSLCYTSGTTGNPKGVLYSHRSTVLHAMASVSPDALSLSGRDVICPVVPMFHVNAWGTPYSAALTGLKLVLPGAFLDGATLANLFAEEGVTVSLGVPTVWLNLLHYIEANDTAIPTLKRLVIGGSAAPPALMAAYAARGITVIHAWGMTELSPLGTVSTQKYKHATLSPEARRSIDESQGRPVFPIETRILDEAGRILPHDGKAVGELSVRGPWILSGYYDNQEANKAAFDHDGWFRTGDVGSIDADGYLRITDRSKDVIKSGGEWISSIDLENAAVGHPDIAEAAVIGVYHPKWDERPLLVVVAKPDHTIDIDSVRAHLVERVAKWWMPDDIVVVDQLPHTATGKVLKAKLRKDFADYKLSTL